MHDLKQAIADFPIARWLSEVAGVPDTGGKYLYADCPVCGGKGKLLVRRQKKSCLCFRCADAGHGRDVWGGQGGLLDLIQLLESCTRYEAAQRVLAMAGWPEGSEITPTSDRYVDWPEEAIPITLARPDHPSRIQLKNRVLEHMEDRVWIAVDGEYADRWILPVWSNGERMGWEAKSYANGTPKSLFPKDWDKASHIYQTPTWDPTQNWVVITESIFDAETFGHNTIGIFGSSLGPGQLGRLLDLRDNGVSQLVWCLDQDATKKAARMMLSRTSHFFDNYFCQLPVGEDPNSLGRSRCWEAVKRATYVSSEFDFFQKSIV